MASLTTADYLAQIRQLIKDQNATVWTDADLTPYIQIGLTEYTRYQKRRQPTSITLQAGQTQYTLPSDWITVDQESFDRAIGLDDNDDLEHRIDIYRYAGFALPTLNEGQPTWAMTFDWYDGEGYLVVNPAPAGTMTLNFAYFGVHTVTSTGSSVPQQDALYVCYKAAAATLNALAIEQGSDMQKYKIGNGLTIDDTEVAKTLIAQATTYGKIFDKFVANRAIGVSG